MTKKEASFILANIDRRVCDDELSEALDIAIKTLEQNSKYRKEARRWKRKVLGQEPCEDATLKDIFCMGCEYKEQEPKTGHWKKIATYPLYECSRCKLDSMLNTWDYCPNCGCHMVESWESEDKE